MLAILQTLLSQCLSINSVNDIVHGSDLIKIESRNYNGGEGVVIVRGRSTNLTDPIVTFKYDTAEKVRINNNGNVGIGTPTPSASLHISGASSNVLLEIDSPTQNNILYVSGSGTIGIGKPTGYSLEIANTSSLLVSATGWTPTTNSTASAAVSIAPNIFATAGNRSYYSLYVANPGITTSGSFGNYDQRSLYVAGKTDLPGGMNSGDSRFYNTSHAVSFQGYNPYNGQTGSVAGGITFTSRQVDGGNEAGIGAYYGAGSRLYIYNKYNASDSKIIFSVGGTIRSSFFGTGNLSIGNEETDMSARLGIKGSGATSSTTALLVQNASNRTSFIVNDDGRVGINVAPYDSYALAVDPISGSTGVYVAQRAVANNTNEYRFVNSTGTPSADSTAGSITWHTLSYLEGIYSSAVIDGYRAVDLRIKGWSGSYAETIRFTYDNKVGIGTTTPAAKLDVNGTFKVSSTSTFDSQATFNNANIVATGINSQVGNFTINRANSNTSVEILGGTTSVKLDADNGSASTMFRGVTSIASSYITASAMLHVRGTGTTSATTALLVQNANASSSLSVKDGISESSTNTGKFQVIAGNWTETTPTNIFSPLVIVRGKVLASL